MLFFQTRVQRGDGRVRDGAVKRSYETHEENPRQYVSLIRLLFPHSSNLSHIPQLYEPDIASRSESCFVLDRDASESVNIVIRNGLSGTKLPINSNHRVNES